jgi:hypothetical protein
VKEASSLGYRLAKPEALYAWFKIRDTDEKSLLLEEGSRLNIGKNIKLWEGAEYLAVALCTIGAELEKRVTELFPQGEPVLASILDSVGSVAADSLEAQIQQRICQQAHQSGMIVGPKLYPGSRDYLPSAPRRKNRCHSHRAVHDDAPQVRLLLQRSRRRSNLEGLGQQGGNQPLPALQYGQLPLPQT